MSQSIATVTLVVRDYDEALGFFTGALGFDVVEDTPLGDGKRRVRVAPPGGSGTALLLARAASVEQERRIGDQTGGRVSFFLQTSRCYQTEHPLDEAASASPRETCDQRAAPAVTHVATMQHAYATDDRVTHQIRRLQLAVFTTA